MTKDRQNRVEQTEFWQQASACHETLIAKLTEARRPDLIGRMRDCHTANLRLVCRGCGKSQIISNRCEKRWCPICVPRLARERRDQLGWWLNTLHQPKHVVLTSRNTDNLTRERVRQFRQALSKLRRTRFARDWKSGTWSLEVTNESRGWHLHAHLLIETRWIDSGKLAREWSKLIGQDFVIVKVKDARKEDYLRELAKYVVKSSQLAGWKALEIVEFMDAFIGTRTFGVFGSLVGQRAAWKRQLRELRLKRATCDCGSCDYFVEDARLGDIEPRDRIKLNQPLIDPSALIRPRITTPRFHEGSTHVPA